MTKETSLWAWLRRAKQHYGSRLKLQRIESGSITSGIPDLYVCCDGISFWVEGKTTSELGIYQLKWLTEHRKAGGTSFIVYNKGNGVRYYEFTNETPIENINPYPWLCIEDMKRTTIKNIIQRSKNELLHKR